MRQLGPVLRMPAAERRKHLAKMKLLAAVRDVNNLVGVPVLRPVLKRREIRRGIVKSAILLLDNEWIRNPFAFFVHKKGVRFGGSELSEKMTLAPWLSEAMPARINPSTICLRRGL